MHENTAILILAAGSSSRLGRPKQLLKLNKHSNLLNHVVSEAINVTTNVYVVLGANEEACVSLLKKYPVKIIHNTDWANGMGSSIKSGMNLLHKSKFEQIIITVCDQPYLTSEVFQALITKQDTSKVGIVYADYLQGSGVPVLFTQKYFSSLLSQSGNNGAKTLIQSNNSDCQSINFPKGSIDIDTEEQYMSYLSSEP